MVDIVKMVMTLAFSSSHSSLRQSLQGKVRYGSFEGDPSVAVRINADETTTHGRFEEPSGEFKPFSPEEEKAFNRKWSIRTGSATVLPFEKKKEE